VSWRGSSEALSRGTRGIVAGPRQRCGTSFIPALRRRTTRNGSDP
jgi:hypothetical protein